jgi:hypothetical protein
MNKRLVAVGSILLILSLVACSLTQLRTQQQASVTSTPTRTSKPTFTPTDTATTTLTPSPSPRPSNTPTQTPIPTNTPISTNTPLPTDTPPPTLTPTITDTPRATNTPTATPRPTSRPTRRPTKAPTPAPTKPPPPPFTGSIVRGYPHCGGLAAVTGHVRHASGDPFAGVTVGVWSAEWQGRVYTSLADGKYDLLLTDVPFGKYQVAVVRLETCGERDGLPTAVDCQRRSNVVEVTVTEDCNVNRVTEVDFTGP